MELVIKASSNLELEPFYLPYESYMSYYQVLKSYMKSQVTHKILDSILKSFPMIVVEHEKHVEDMPVNIVITEDNKNNQWLNFVSTNDQKDDSEIRVYFIPVEYYEIEDEGNDEF